MSTLLAQALSPTGDRGPPWPPVASLSKLKRGMNWETDRPGPQRNIDYCSGFRIDAMTWMFIDHHSMGLSAELMRQSTAR